MPDITGLGKIIENTAKLADSKLAMRTYDDLLADATKETGTCLVDTVKTFRLFTAPIQLLAVAQDRLAEFCQRVRKRVPEERQQEAAPSIALPVLMDLRFMEDDNPLTELYLTLLTRAIDKERSNEAHPAFVKIIGQMSPDEAVVIYHFRDQTHWLMPMPIEYGVWGGAFPILSLAQPTNFHMYAQHLTALNLLTLPTETLELQHHSEFDGTLRVSKNEDPYLTLTEFGKLFIKACIPENVCLENIWPQNKATHHDR